MDTPRRLFAVVIVSFAFFGISCGGGGSANSSPNQNPSPSIGSLSPGSAVAGASAQTLTINGAGFLTSSTVTYNGNAHAATYVSSTKLTIQLAVSDQATAGTYAVVVTNPTPGGGSSSPSNFTVDNPKPAMTAISPSVVAVGSPDTTITVAGTNLVRTSEVVIGSESLSTKFVSATQLTATLPASNLASAATLQVTVNNPSPGGGTSSTQDLTVVKVNSLVILGTPSTVGKASGSWQIAVSAVDTKGDAIANLPIALQTSTGALSTSGGVTDSGGGLTATLTPPASATSAITAAISATAGGQTAVIQVTFPSPTAASSNAGNGTQPASTTTNSLLQATASPMSIGLANSPGTPNPFLNSTLLQSGCASDLSLSAAETTTCQGVLGQNNVQLSAPSTINASCHVLSLVATGVSLADCGVSVGTVLSCVAAETGIGGAICAATADFTVTIAAPACMAFLAHEIANQFGTNSVTAAEFEGVALVENPTNPLELTSLACTVAQSLFSSGPRIFAVNSSGNSITVLDLQGNVVTMPPGSFPNTNAPDGLAFDPDNGLLYVGNSGNDTVTAYNPKTGSQVTTSGTFPAGQCTGYDVTYGEFSHDLYVNGAFCNQMFAYDADGNSVTLSSGAFSNITDPFGMTFNSLNGQLLISDGVNDRIFVCDSSGMSCETSTAFPSLSEPDDLAVAPDGNIYVPNEANGTVTEYSPAGTLLNTITPSTLLAFPVPETVAFNSKDAFTYQILVSDSSQDVIWVYDSKGNLISKLGGPQVLNGPKGIVVIQ